MLVKNGFIFPRVRVENEKYLSCHHLDILGEITHLKCITGTNKPFFQSVYLLVAVLAHRWRGIEATIDDCLAMSMLRIFRRFCFGNSSIEQREVDLKTNFDVEHFSYDSTIMT